MIHYKNISLFDVPKNSLLVHACNCQGVWERGIAGEFKKRFPLAFKEYSFFCKENLTLNIPSVGRSLIIKDGDYYIGCLLTSFKYAPDELDPPSLILKQTKSSLIDLLTKASSLGDLPIYSNKFNSGLFQVPWEDTEDVIKQVKSENLAWTICTPPAL